MTQCTLSKDDSIIVDSSAVVFNKDDKVWELKAFQFSDISVGDFQIIKMFINSDGKLVIKFEDNT